MKFEPAYLELFSTGELERRAEAAYRHLEDCDLCAVHRIEKKMRSYLSALRQSR